MKKIVLLLTFLLFIPNINASSIYDFEFTKENIYDYADVLGEFEYERLTDKIKEFELKSSIDVSLITVSSNDELIAMTNTLIGMEVNNKKSIYIPSVVIIFEKNGEMNIVSNTYYKDVWNRKSLQKFETYKLNKYNNIFIYETELDLMLQDWIDYYDNQNLINIVLIITIALLMTLIIIKILTKEYRPKFITEADKYIKEDKIIVK